MNGSEVFLQVIKKAGIQYVFGAPGTTEISLIDKLAAEEGVGYILALHESVAVGMADGYARATGKTGLASVHTTVGTANSLGIMINSYSDRVPLLVTAGCKDHRALGTGVFCDSPYFLPDMAREYSKWSGQVLEARYLARDLSKALRLTQTLPAGPVFLSIPENFFLEEDVYNTNLPVRPPGENCRGYAGDIKKALNLLHKAKRPVLMVGNEVGREGCIDQAINLAEKWQFPVFSEERLALTNTNFPTDHPLYVGTFNPENGLIQNADLLLSIGTRLFLPFSYKRTEYLRPETKIIHVSSDQNLIGNMCAVELGIFSNAKAALEDLMNGSAGGREGESLQKEEVVKFKEKKKRAKNSLLMEAGKSKNIRVPYLVDALSRYAADNAMIINQGVRSGFYLHDFFQFHSKRKYFGSSGGYLGWGLPAAMGIQLAHPGVQAISFLGDGSFLFSPQALWTAAHYNIPVKIILCNNRSYMAVKSSLRKLNGYSKKMDKFLGCDITEPEIDYVSLCKGFGVSSWKIDTPEEVPEALSILLNHNGPALLEVLVDSKDMEERLS